MGMTPWPQDDSSAEPADDFDISDLLMAGQRQRRYNGDSVSTVIYGELVVEKIRHGSSHAGATDVDIVAFGKYICRCRVAVILVSLVYIAAVFGRAVRSPLAWILKCDWYPERTQQGSLANRVLSVAFLRLHFGLR
jgi:hypothetical protein